MPEKPTIPARNPRNRGAPEGGAALAAGSGESGRAPTASKVRLSYGNRHVLGLDSFVRQFLPQLRGRGTRWMQSRFPVISGAASVSAWWFSVGGAPRPSSLSVLMSECATSLPRPRAGSAPRVGRTSPVSRNRWIPALERCPHRGAPGARSGPPVSATPPRSPASPSPGSIATGYSSVSAVATVPCGAAFCSGPLRPRCRPSPPGCFPTSPRGPVRRGRTLRGRAHAVAAAAAGASSYPFPFACSLSDS